MRILIIEDDRYTAEAFKIALVEASYTVEIATENLLNWELLELLEYDLILLDAALPKLDNLVLCKRLRDNGCQIPVLVMIDSHPNPDLKIGLEAIASDYIIKPFDLQDLTRRIDFLLNKDVGLTQSVLTWGSLTLNTYNQQLLYAENQIDLDLRESCILELLFRQKNRIFSSSFICDRIFVFDITVTKQTIRNIIKNLINKIESLGISNPIETVYGTGYWMTPNLTEREFKNVRLYPDQILLTTSLYIISPDVDFTDKIVLEAVNWGLKTQVVTRLVNAIAQIANDPTNVLILDVLAFHKIAELREFLGELYIRRPLISVVIFLTEKDIKERLTISDFGHQVVYSKSASPLHILKIVTQGLTQYSVRECKILVIDSNPHILSQLRNILEPWGFIILTLEDNFRFQKTMTVFCPEILILGEFNSPTDILTLCESIRATSEWENLPIIFLISNLDDSLIHQIFDAGADDFICQPVIGPELVNRLLSCWEKVKRNRHHLETNLITPISNYDASTKDLEKLLHLAKRQNQNLSLVIVRVNNFAEISKLFGYVTSNNVLHFLSKFLKECLRTEDVVARWGEELLVSMYGTNKVDAIERFNQILLNIHTQQFLSASGAKFAINCSIQISQYPQDGTDINSLYQSTRQNSL
jgi:diguanylate cyclase (GGDEF)-like protein